MCIELAMLDVGIRAHLLVTRMVNVSLEALKKIWSIFHPRVLRALSSTRLKIGIFKVGLNPERQKWILSLHMRGSGLVGLGLDLMFPTKAVLLDTPNLTCFAIGRPSKA